MVVSRQHFPNLASMGEAGIREYTDLVSKIMGTPPYALDLLEAEHGSSEQEMAGACISHVHVNLIPGLGGYVKLMDGHLPQLQIDTNLTRLQPSAAPYIMVRGAGQVRLYNAKGVPSQYIRRVLFEKIGRDDWDWGVFPHHDIVRCTLQLWSRGSGK